MHIGLCVGMPRMRVCMYVRMYVCMYVKPGTGHDEHLIVNRSGQHPHPMRHFVQTQRLPPRPDASPNSALEVVPHLM